MSHYCHWCGEEVLTSNHVCKQAINREKMEANLSNVSRLVDKHKLYVVMEYIRDLDMMTINSIWKSKELATLRALHIDGYVNEHLLEDWSL